MPMITIDSSPSPGLIFAADYVCAECNGAAGRLELCEQHADFLLIRQGILQKRSFAIGPDASRALRGLLRRGRGHDVFLADLEYTPWYCPQCAASYCANHWHIYSYRGTCPVGHQRM